MKKVLFCTPTGGRTGSEMMLQYMLATWQDLVSPHIYTRGTGEVFSAYPTVTYPKRGDFVGPFYEGIYFKVKKESPEFALLRKLQHQERFDMWYLNTIQMYSLAPLAVEMGIPYWVHVHELLSVYEELPREAFDFLLKNAAKIIACGTQVLDCIQSMGYGQVVLVHEGIDTRLMVPSGQLHVRQSLGIPSDIFLWAMSGTANTRKGYDLVPELLSYLPPTHGLLWIGGESKTGLGHYVTSRCRHENRAFFQVGPQTDQYYDYLAAAQGFVLLSREDPYPLVMLEAAYFGLPVLGFSSGGVSEFVEPSFGEVVEGISPKALAQRMISWADQPAPVNAARAKAMQFDVMRRKSEFQDLFRA